MDTVLITPRSLSRDGHPALERIARAGYTAVFPAPGRQPSEDDLLETANSAVGYLAGVEPISRRFLEAATRLKVISRNGVGTDNVDLAAANELGIRVERAIGTNSRGVAELAVGHMLAAARSIPFHDNVIKAGGWERRKGIELHGRVLGLIGCGSIGRLVALLAGALGMRVNAYDPYPDAEFGSFPEFNWTSFEAALDADVVSLHCPPTPNGFVIGAGEIERMRDGVIIVNTARDGLVDPDAVAAAIDTGKVGALTVDAFAMEPPVDRSIPDRPQVIATPHIGGFTTESVDRATDAAVDNLLNVLQEK